MNTKRLVAVGFIRPDTGIVMVTEEDVLRVQQQFGKPRDQDVPTTRTEPTEVPPRKN